MRLKNIKRFILFYSFIATLNLLSRIFIGKNPVTPTEIIKMYISTIIICFFSVGYLSLLEKLGENKIITRWFSKPKPIPILILWFKFCIFCILCWGVPVVSFLIASMNFVFFLPTDTAFVIDMYIKSIFYGFMFANLSIALFAIIFIIMKLIHKKDRDYEKN